MTAVEGGIVPIPDSEKFFKNFLESFKRRLKKGSWVCILLPGSVLSSNVPMGADGSSRYGSGGKEKEVYSAFYEYCRSPRGYREKGKISSVSVCNSFGIQYKFVGESGQIRDGGNVWQ